MVLVNAYRLSRYKKIFSSNTTNRCHRNFNSTNWEKRRWWVFYNKPNSYKFNEFPFNLGPFIFISLWTLKLAYGNFKKYLLINAIVNALFAFPFSSLAKNIKYYSLVRFNHAQFFMYFFVKAPLLYFLQYYFENRKQLKLNKQR